ncbi:MAG: GGDEF domain-containing protein [Armatimonadota bacterium]
MLEHEQQDELTGFLVRKSFIAFMETILYKSKVAKSNFSIVLLDVDHFKKFNDKFGHPFGNMILKYIASTLRLNLQDTIHQIFRYGGDEFVIVFLDMKPEEAYKSMLRCKFILANRPFLYGSKLFHVTISCGIAGFPQDADRMEELVAKADKAMYFSKRHGRYGIITQIGKLPLIKFCINSTIAISIATIFLSFYIIYNNALKDVIRPIKRKITDIKIISKSGDLDVLIMKNGRIFEGYIIDETQDKVFINLCVEKGTGKAVFDKKDISKITRRTK